MALAQRSFLVYELLSFHPSILAGDLILHFFWYTHSAYDDLDTEAD